MAIRPLTTIMPGVLARALPSKHPALKQLGTVPWESLRATPTIPCPMHSILQALLSIGITYLYWRSQVRALTNTAQVRTSHGGAKPLWEVVCLVHDINPLVIESFMCWGGGSSPRPLSKWPKAVGFGPKAPGDPETSISLVGPPPSN